MKTLYIIVNYVFLLHVIIKNENICWVCYFLKIAKINSRKRNINLSLSQKFVPAKYKKSSIPCHTVITIIIKICAHTGQHGILRNVSIPSDECTLPSLLTLRLKLFSKKAGIKACFFLQTISLILNTVVSIWVQDPDRPRRLYRSEDEESLCPPGTSVQKREPLSALYYFKTSQAPQLYKNS